MRQQEDQRWSKQIKQGSPHQLAYHSISTKGFLMMPSKFLPASTACVTAVLAASPPVSEHYLPVATSTELSDAPRHSGRASSSTAAAAVEGLILQGCGVDAAQAESVLTVSASCAERLQQQVAGPQQDRLPMRSKRVC